MHIIYVGESRSSIYDGLVAMFGENHVHVYDGWQTAEQHKDTTIIILGDARNNSCNPYDEDLKYIADRCGKVFWLNPEPTFEWDT